MRRLLDHILGDRLSRTLRSQWQGEPLQQAAAALRQLKRQCTQLERTYQQQQQHLRTTEDRYLNAVRRYRTLITAVLLSEAEAAELASLDVNVPCWKADLEIATAMLTQLEQTLTQARDRLKQDYQEWQRLQQQAQRTAALSQKQQLQAQLDKSRSHLDAAAIAVSEAEWQTEALAQLTSGESTT